MSKRKILFFGTPRLHPHVEDLFRACEYDIVCVEHVDTKVLGTELPDAIVYYAEHYEHLPFVQLLQVVDEMVPVILIGHQVDSIATTLMEIGLSAYLSDVDGQQIRVQIEALWRLCDAGIQYGRDTPKPPALPRMLESGDIRIDLDQGLVTKQGIPVDLSDRQYNLLVYFVQNPNRVISDTEFKTKAWGGVDFDDMTVGTHVKRLRDRLFGRSTDRSKRIQTVYDRGYRFSTV